MREWWTEFFDDVYGDFILHTFNDEEIKQAVQYLVNKFSINESTKVYDQCCGKGSVSLPLLEKTRHVYGCDIIKSYIDFIQSKTTHGTFVAADARDYIPEDFMDLVINWHTSFGYSRDTADNLKMLQAAYKSLRKGGSFIMEYINFEYVVKHFQKKMIVKTNIKNEPLTLVRASSFEDGMLKQEWSIKEKPEWRKFGETKIYFTNDLVDMFKSVGFKNVDVFFSLEETLNSKESSPKIYIEANK